MPGLGNHAEVEPGRNVGEAWPIGCAEVAFSNAERNLLLAAAATVAADDGEAGYFCDPGSVEARGIYDCSVDGRFAESLEGQQRLHIVRFGEDQAYTAHEFTAGNASEQTVNRVLIEFVGLHAVRASRLVTQLLAVHGVTDPEHRPPEVLAE